jgi:3-oxoacyl-[acyl-carrier protein] reductase
MSTGSPPSGWSTPFSEFEGKTVLVTGASTGIGAAVAKAFAECGAKVAIHYRSSASEAEAVRSDIRAAGGTAQLFRADLSDPAAAASLASGVASELGGLHVLINNAGDTFARQPIVEMESDAFQRIIDLNLGSVFALCRSAIPIFRLQGAGTIVNTSSISARLGGSAGSVAYAATKGAVSTFTRGLARELAPLRIRVNGVAPGVIDTPLHARNTPPEVMEKFVEAIPLRRVGVPEDCVGAYLYLASERLSSFVTGQILEVNGGHSMY